MRHDGTEQLFSARFECVVELGPDQKGAHMSRFEEVINEAIGEVVLGEATFKVETLAEHIAQLVRARLLIGEARTRLQADGFHDDDIEKIFVAVPVATHNQRGLGTLHIGCTELCDDEIDAAALLEIVEHAMSSEIYELMKRSDEAHVVEKAHRRPRFVEDCVREMIRGTIDAFPQLGDAAFVEARQVNLETIHQHDVVAERFGTLGEIRDELNHGIPQSLHTTRRAWLDAVP